MEQSITNPPPTQSLLPDIVADDDIIHDIQIINVIRANQHSILKHYEEEVQSLVLTGVPLGRGSVEHYYHFIFDLLLPLSILIARAPENVCFNVFHRGPLTSHLKQLFGKRVNIVSNKAENQVLLPLLGMSPVSLKKLDFNIDVLRTTVLKRFVKTTPPTERQKVILIKRVAPAPFYLNEAEVKGGGSERRSIANHVELRELLKSKISDQYEFVSLVLEEMPFAEQVQYFNSAILVIGLHGAGLTNTIWMQPESYVVEIGFNSNPHFQRTSQIMRHHHYTYKNYNQQLIEIDLPHFENWLDTQLKKTKLLKTKI